LEKYLDLGLFILKKIFQNNIRNYNSKLIEKKNMHRLSGKCANCPISDFSCYLYIGIRYITEV